MTLSSRELGLLSNTDVLGYIQAQNAARNAQAKAEGWEFWTLMAESLERERANWSTEPTTTPTMGMARVTQSIQ